MIESIMVMEKKDNESNGSKPSWGLIAVAWIWLIGFAIWFQRFGFVNNGNVSRWLLWSLIPFDLMDLIDPPVDKTASPWSYFYLLQRLPFVLIAVSIWVAGWGLGSQILSRLSLRFKGAEQVFFATCVGLSGLSLLMLLVGLCGWMSQPLMMAILTVCIATGIATRLGSIHTNEPDGVTTKIPQVHASSSRLLGWIVVGTIALFFLAQQLGAMTPQNDFDVVEYHLGGPKEWYQRGRIERLPHNVYTSFPFLTEMLILTGMVTYGDWQWGALAGQAAIAGFAPLTAIGLFAAGRRFFSSNVGWIAALVYMTSPWTYRTSIISYVEGGLACYLFASLYAVLIYREQIVHSNAQERLNLAGIVTLAGMLSGSAMACKYPALVTVVGPIGLMIAWLTWFQPTHNRVRQIVFAGLFFSIGLVSSIGPWLLKNTIETGNPVYPLAVRVFGGVDRDEELDAKFRRGHGNNYKSTFEQFRDLPVMLTDVMANNDWHSPLMFGLAPLSLLACIRRRRSDSLPQKFEPGAIGLIWVYVAWQFISFWLFTHHIDRFYVPMFSAVSLLAGVGVMWFEPTWGAWSKKLAGKLWKTAVAGLCIGSILYNVVVMKSIGGWNAGRTELKAAYDRTVQQFFPRIDWINEQIESGRMPANTKILCVGEAQLFHARFPYLYNTVFDHSLFEKLCAEPGSDGPRLKPTEQIKAEFRRLGITHIDVNWAEIMRYRDPASYGYTDFVHPDRFVEMQKMGILGPQILPQEYSISVLNGNLRDRLLEWAPNLILPRSFNQDEQYYISAQLFPVLTGDQ